MTKAPKQRPQVGDTRWVVEWCTHCATLPDDPTTHDADGDKYAGKAFAEDQEAEARAFAESVYPKCQHGQVELSHQEFVAYDPDDAALYPHAGFWEDTSDAVYFSGEWEG